VSEVNAGREQCFECRLSVSHVLTPFGLSFCVLHRLSRPRRLGTKRDSGCMCDL
jgi:hypothetical protein